MNRIINQNKKATLILLDIATIAFSFLGAFSLRFDFNITAEFLLLLAFWFPLFVVIQITTFNFSGFYNVIWRFTSLWDILNIIKAVIVSNLVGFSIIMFFQGVQGYPRSILLIFFILNLLSICLLRVLVRLYHSHFHFITQKIDINKIRLILIGAGKTGEKITREIRNTVNSQYTVIGLVDDDTTIQGSTLHGAKVLGTIKDLVSLSAKFDEILITAPSASGDQLRSIIKICKLAGKNYKTVPSLNELIDKDISIATIRNVSYTDLLGRDEVKLNMHSIEKVMSGKRILITGAGGSIGSELVRQCLIFKPSEIICLDNSDENIFNLEHEIGLRKNNTILKYYLCNINSIIELNKTFTDTQPQIVLHAAAYKHVPIQEEHPWCAVKTNVKGTLNLVTLSDKFNVNLFVLVSTDKAVNPVNVMGATKRAAEKIIQSYNQKSQTSYMAVRFGNVLGSSGSAIPIFEKQISNGGPLTITHPEMTRYFMSIQEASQLILQCCALGKQGEIFLLEMGSPIKILQMAKDLIRLSGLEPEIDIPIVFTGLRPGEKLYEELQLKGEKKIYTEHKKIMILKSFNLIEPWPLLHKKVNILINAGAKLNSEKIQSTLKKILPTYQSRLSSFESSDSTELEELKAQA